MIYDLIVNDLFTIANKLPKRIVKNALSWLMLQNHFYHSVDLHRYKDSFDWDSVSEVDIPVIELTDEDELQLDKDNASFNHGR